jgi:predicted porin
MHTRTKKLLLAAGLAASCTAPAFAQSNVTVSGLVDAFAGSTRMAGDPGRANVVGSGGLTTSWFGFKGTEDLGNGLKAKFALTSFFQMDTGRQGRFPSGDTFFSRDANVGLTGSFGSISLGRDLAPNFLPTILFNPFGDSFTFSPLILHADVPAFGAKWTNTLAGDTGWSNELLYTTPSFGGLTANIHYQFGEVPGDTGTHNVGANALYFNGPLALTAFYHRVQVNNPLAAPAGNVQPGANVFGGIAFPGNVVAARQTAWMLGGTYDFTAAKVFATYGKTTHDIDVQDKTLSLGLSVPAGGGKVLAAWAQTKRDGAVVGADLKRNTTSIGYDYDISKRTDLYAIVMNDRITSVDSGNSFGLGIRHRF